MAKANLSKEWTDLINAVGGMAGVCEALDMPQTTFYRASRGIVAFPESKREALSILCDLYEVANPVDTQPRARVKDLAPLGMLGDALAKGFPPAERALEKLRQMYPQDQLVELAESDGTSERILRAVTLLLDKP
jgi:hypothetical protein